MVMNFWEAKRRARSRTAWYSVLFVLLTFGVACSAEYIMRTAAGPENYSPSFPFVGAFFLFIIFAAALFQYSMYRTQGGAYVAKAVGARRIDPNRASLKEQQVLNIVEEMALAASLPVPPVYLLEAKEINAFAAGLTPQNAVITVTEGSLNLLSRDELQGVIAHELGHISNADMVISLRLAAMIMGFFFVLYVAMRLLQFSGMSGGRNNNRRANPIAIAALIMLVAGAFTWLFGSILKCAVSRQREYLADASAVQFTRNSQGIANALRKIAGETIHDMPKSGMAFSHMYFEDASFLSSLFATHPPIKKRIQAIEDEIAASNTKN
jgi:heat shock protein HtpX